MTQENYNIEFTHTFHETQQINRRLWWLISSGTVLIWAVIFYLSFIQSGSSFSNDPYNTFVWLSIVFLGLMTMLFYRMRKLIIEVRFDRLDIRSVPFVTREILFSDIKSFQARQYNPGREYGGWGNKKTIFGRKMAYTIKGNWGVDIELTNGRFVLIGSQKANELEDAITTAMQIHGKT